jgi:hypothetical protein
LILEHLPDDSLGWVQWAFSLHKLKQTKGAQEVLLSIVHKFPTAAAIHYILACFACQMGEFSEAKIWLAVCFKLGGKTEVQREALSDLDLKPLWKPIAEMR